VLALALLGTLILSFSVSWHLAALFSFPTQQSSETAEAVGLERTTTVVVTTMLVMAITTCVAVTISFYLYRWRRLLSTEGRFTVPEELAASLKSIAKQIGKLSTRIGDIEREHRIGIQVISETSKRTDESVSDLLQTTLMLQRALDEKDGEIRRLRQGYDAELFSSIHCPFRKGQTGCR
jgi:hypothetical protein